MGISSYGVNGETISSTAVATGVRDVEEEVLTKIERQEKLSLIKDPVARIIAGLWDEGFTLRDISDLSGLPSSEVKQRFQNAARQLQAVQGAA